VDLDPYASGDDNRRKAKPWYWLVVAGIVIPLLAAGIGAWAQLAGNGKMPCPRTLFCEPAPTQSPVPAVVVPPPQVSISPDFGVLNTRVEIKIIGFEKNEPVVVSLAGRELSWLTWAMDQSGALRLPPVPLRDYLWDRISEKIHLPPGSLKFTVTGKVSQRTADVTFHLTT
jgi:hypothetical protein